MEDIGTIKFKKWGKIKEVRSDYTPTIRKTGSNICVLVGKWMDNIRNSKYDIGTILLMRIARWLLIATGLMILPAIIWIFGGKFIVNPIALYHRNDGPLMVMYCIARLGLAAVFVLSTYKLWKLDFRQREILSEYKEGRKIIRMMKYGGEKLLRKTRAKLYKGPSEKGNAIYEINKWKFETIRRPRILVYSCPSTQKLYTKFVDRDSYNPDECQAQRFNLRLPEYLSIRNES